MHIIIHVYRFNGELMNFLIKIKIILLKMQVRVFITIFFMFFILPEIVGINSYFQLLVSLVSLELIKAMMINIRDREQFDICTCILYTQYYSVYTH